MLGIALKVKTVQVKPRVILAGFELDAEEYPLNPALTEALRAFPIPNGIVHALLWYCMHCSGTALTAFAVHALLWQCIFGLSMMPEWSLAKVLNSFRLQPNQQTLD